METNNSDVFALFGPGVIFSHNTLQNFIDFFMRKEFNNYQVEIPFIMHSSKQNQNSDIDQLSDLDEGRAFLLQKFEKFLILHSIEPPKIIVPEISSPDLSVCIAETFLFPSLELIFDNNPTCPEETIEALSTFFNSNNWNGENDIPVISHRIVLLLGSIFQKTKQLNISENTIKMLVQLWLTFFESRGNIDDLLIFTIAWIKRDKQFDFVNIDTIIKSIKQSIIYPTIASASILTNPSNMKESKTENNSVSQSNRRNVRFSNQTQPVSNPPNAPYIFNTSNPEPNEYQFGYCCSGIVPRQVQLYVGKLIDQKSVVPSNIIEIVPRRAAAMNGFLYVADPRFGLAKIGTGLNGTVFSSLEVVNHDYINQTPQSIAICNDKVLARFIMSTESTSKICNPIEVLEFTSLTKVGSIISDGTLSTDEDTSTLTNSQTNSIPCGPFTAFFNRVYFIENTILFIYEMSKSDNSLSFSCSISLSTNNIIDHLVSLVTNGQILSIFYPQKLNGNSNVSVQEFNIENGSMILDQQIPNLKSNMVCFDPISLCFFDLPDYETSSIYHCQPNILSYYNYPFPTSLTGIPPLDILNTLPSLLSSRLSDQIISLKSKYVLTSTDYLYQALEAALAANNYEMFVVPLIRILILHLQQFTDSAFPSIELIKKLVTYTKISVSDKIAFIRSLFQSMNSPLSSIENLSFVLDSIEPFLFIEATKTFNDFPVILLTSILSAKENKFVQYAFDNFDHSSYSFIQILIGSITRYSYQKDRIRHSFILPVFQALRPVKNHLFLSIMATMIPILQKALSEPISFASSLKTFEVLLKEIHSMIPPNALKDYANTHISVSSEQPFFVKTIIDETPHPYLNNMDYVHHYDFPSAIDITIVFDQKTSTEINCDFLQIFSDTDCLKKITDKFSGRLSQWKEKIVTNSKHLAIRFHSDGSVVDWGYRAIISAKIFSRNNFTSPHPAYDVFRSFFDILLKMMKICDASTQYIPDNCINFDDYKSLYIRDLPEFTKKLLSKFDIKSTEETYSKYSSDLIDFINKKYGTAIPTNYELASQQLSIIDYVLSNPKQIRSDFVESIIESPYPLNSFDSRELSQHFSNLANLMLFYIPQGIPDSELDFLYKSLKGTKASEKFVQESLAFTQNSFKSDNLTLSTVCYAANKASLAFQLMLKPDYDSLLHHWFDCLRALSKIQTIPNTTTSLGSILDFGCMFDDTFGDANDFLSRHLAILNETPINSPSVDLPVVSLILSRLLLMKTNNVDNDIISSLILRVLRFCLPYIVPLVKELIDKFDVCLDSFLSSHSHMEDFMMVLQEIGDEYNRVQTITEPDSICFDSGVSFSCLKAECLRNMFKDVSIFDGILKNGTKEQKQASLLILSSTLFQLQPTNSVYIDELNLNATIVSIDPFRFVLKTDNVYEISFPAFDFKRFCMIDKPFHRIKPKPFSCPTSLTNTIIDELNQGNNTINALNALNGLLQYTSIDFNSLFVKLFSQMKNGELYENKNNNHEGYFMQYMPINEALSSNQIAYIYTKPICCYRISMPHLQGRFGFCEKGNLSPSSAIFFECNEKFVIHNERVLAENESITSISIGYLTQGMRLFFIVNRQLKLTDIYLPPSRTYIPLIITNSNKEILFESSPVIDLPIFSHQLTTIGYQPTHLFLNDKIVMLKNICSPIHHKCGEPLSIDLFPAVSKALPYYYLEFCLFPELTSIMLTSPLHRLYSFYTYETPTISANDTYGLFINFQEHYCFITLNETILPNSVNSIPDSDWIITFNTKSLEAIFINVGQLPFMFDLDSFVAFLNGKKYNSILDFNNNATPLNEEPQMDDSIVHIKEEPKSFPPIRTQFNIVSPLQQPFFVNKSANMNLFTSNQPKFFKSSTIRPCLVNTSEKGGFYHYKVGYGQIDETKNTINLLISKDKSFTLSNIQFPVNTVNSLLDETSNSNDEFQQIYHEFISSIPIDFLNDLSPTLLNSDMKKSDSIRSMLIFDDTTSYRNFYNINRQLQFFDSLEKVQKQNIMNICLSKMIEQIGFIETIQAVGLPMLSQSNEYTFEDYLIQTITLIDVNDFEPYEDYENLSYRPILTSLFDQSINNDKIGQLFDRLALKAIEPFEITEANFKDAPLNMICYSGDINNTTNRITIHDTDAILFVPVDITFVDHPHTFNDNYNNLFIIPKEQQKAPIFIMKGNTVTFNSFNENEFMLSHVIPIKFNSPQSSKLNFRFSIQFLVQLIEYLSHNSNNLLYQKVHTTILLKMWTLYMNNSERLFPLFQSKLFSLIFEHSLSNEMRNDYLKTINFDIIIKDQPNILTGMICILTLFVRCDVNSNQQTQDNLAHLLEFTLASPINNYSIQVYRQFAYEMLNPLRSFMPFPSSQTEFRPLLTTLAYKALFLTRVPPQTQFIILNENNDRPLEFVHTFEGAKQVAFMKLLPLNKTTISMNKTDIQPDCIIDGHSVNIKISRCASDNLRTIAFAIIPIYPYDHPHSSDVNTLHHYNKQLKEKWTEDDESLAQAIADKLITSNSFYAISIYPDDIIHLLFSHIDANVVRYRLALIYLSYSSLDEWNMPNFTPICFMKSQKKAAFGGWNNIKLESSISSILIPKLLTNPTAHTPLCVSLPLKNAQYSDFFFQLAQIIDTAPSDSLLLLGSPLQPAGESESQEVNTVLSILTNDMFKDGLPMPDSTCNPAMLRAYQAFGSFIASLANMRNDILPVVLRKEIIMYIFGNDIHNPMFDFIKLNLNAMRSGALKIELICPSIKQFGDPIQAELLRYQPLIPIKITDDVTNELHKFLVDNPLLMPLARKIMNQHYVLDRINCLNVSFINSITVDYDFATNTISLPDVSSWIEAFEHRVPQSDSQNLLKA